MFLIWNNEAPWEGTAEDGVWYYIYDVELRRNGSAALFMRRILPLE